MNTRLRNKQINFNEQTNEVKKCVVKLRRIKKTEARKPKTYLLQDQHIENIKPIKDSIPPRQFYASQQSKVKKNNFAKLPETTQDACIETIKKSCITFKNPALSLRKRRGQELELKKTDPKENCTSKNEKIPVNSESSTNARQNLDTNKTDNKNTKKNFQKTSQNLTHKHDLITDILLRNDLDDDESPQQNENNLNEAPIERRNSFTAAKNQTDNAKNSKKRPEVLIKNKNELRKSQRKTCKSNIDDVYEFLSQSQSSNSDRVQNRDPAADIIKKLINEGKVAVTKNVKGRPVVKYKRGPKKKIAATKSKKKLLIEKNLNTSLENENNVNSDIEENIVEQENAEILKILPPVEDLPIIEENNNISIVSHGTFSGLARSVLNRQSGIRRPTHQSIINSRKTPLENVVSSTPYRKQQNVQSPQTTDFSPIPSANTSSTGEVLDRSVPKLLSFLNSFGENVPQIIREKIRNVQCSLGFSNKTMQAEHEPEHTMPSSSSLFVYSGAENLPAQNLYRKQQNNEQPEPEHTMPLSSCSSNDSNAENLPPQNPRNTLLQNHDNHDENSIIHSARQFPNPRRALTHRSPLKPINIIEVITLPPYKKPEETNTTKISESSKNSNESEALFGFEEYIDEDIEEDNLEDKSVNNDKSKASTSRLHLELQKLKKYRTKKSLKKDVNNKATTTKHIFTDNFAPKKDRNIKEMFCSTMINNRSAKNKNKTTNYLSSDSDDEENNTYKTLQGSNENLDLFGDPISTFDSKSLHRTYERPFKRKRKLPNQYSIFLDSDDNSEDEDIQNKSPAKTVKHRKKKPKDNDEQKNNKELEKFAKEFNTMLKEAEDYELIVQ